MEMNKTDLLGRPIKTIIIPQHTFDQARALLDDIQVVCDDPQSSYHIPRVLMDRLIALQAAMEAQP